MSITILQTSDATFYAPILAETSKTVRAYCRRYGIRYEQYIGVKRGLLPWQATYNRIYMLKEMLDRGLDGWVLYMDADSMIADHNFDLREYLWNNRDYAAIFAGYCTAGRSYDINAGGFAINFSHPVGRSIVLDYWRVLQSVPDEEFQASIFWEKDIIEDQYMLFLVLQDYVLNKKLGDSIRFEQSNESFVNQGPFIKQLLRSTYPSFQARLDTIAGQVAEIMRAWPDAYAPDSAGTYISADHLRVHTSSGVKRFGSIQSRGEAGMLVYGPYIDFPAGRYVGRIVGSARASAGGEVRLHADIASEEGTKIWAEGTIRHAGDRFGILVEQEFELTRDAALLEFRLSADADQNVRVDAIQFAKID